MSQLPAARASGWTLVRSLFGFAAALGGILLCVFAITSISGPLVKGDYEWLGHTIVAAACLGALVFGYVAIRCKIAFILGVRELLSRLVE